ncbi:PorP/SprF family type IX secretion system membrane protein [Leptobacterium sp. I13]|uniref:PorP/SprF family type IX secretion system membrane protein n=1 Tax=Leptobacterium meishanense TaxID=3128904 RepID=UPI0030EC9BA9
MKLHKLLFLLLAFCSALTVAQEENPFISFEIPSQNLLKFNRFLINPTFSTVREDNSYINLFHRNQWIEFDDSPEVYLASYSGRIGDRMGLGLGVYKQKLGVISNFGALANYAYGIKLSEKSNLTFGFNFSFFNSGLDRGELFPGMPDPALESIQDNAFLSFQPGFNLSIGAFDFGLYAENIVDYNLRTGKSVTDFSEKTFSAHAMYTKKFKKDAGVLQDARMSLLTRGRKQGDRDANLSGSLILDLPKVGWVQGGYDDFYGVSGGIGFNITKRLSLGYTVEKGLSDGIQNLGTTHEISFGYSFQPNLTEDRVLLEENNDKLALIEEKVISKDEELNKKDEEIAALKKNLDENNMVIAELILRQDSLEKAINNDIEKRFFHLIKSMKNDTPNKYRTKIAYEKKKEQPGKNRVYNTSYKNDFIKQAKVNNIKQQSFKNLKGVVNGYYIIANVYKGDYYLNKFIKKLKNDGFEVDYFINPKNNMKYVYLKRFDNWQEALTAYKSSLNNTYHEAIWIMNVENKKTPQYATNKNNALVTKSTPKTEKERITSPINTPLSYTENNKKSVSSDPSVTNTSNRITASTKKYKNKSNGAKLTDKTKPLLPKKDPEPYKTAYFDLESKTEEEIKQLYSQNTPIKRKTAKKGPVLTAGSLDEGYYIITNVFEIPTNAIKFVKYLNSKGLDADYFINPKNNYRYVYIKKHLTWNSALASYYSNVNNSYFDEIWIMRVNTNYVL